jgi:hypothetical protein
LAKHARGLAQTASPLTHSVMLAGGRPPETPRDGRPGLGLDIRTPLGLAHQFD